MQPPMMASPIPEVPFAAPQALTSAPPGYWFFGTPPQVQGPVPQEAIANFIRSGRLPPSTPVWTQGMPGFTAANAALPSLQNDAVVGLLVPTGPQSGSAVAAGYLAVFGLIIPLLGLIGVIVGFLALGDLKRNPHKKGVGRAWTGIILGGLETLGLIAIILSAVLK